MLASLARAALAALALSAAAGCARRDAGPPPARPPRAHVILVVADGLHLEHERAASRFLAGADEALVLHDRRALPVRAAVTTWDVDTYDAHARRAGRPPYDPASFDPLLGYDPALGGAAPSPLARGDGPYLSRAATDSAAAATALATGVKTDAGNVAWRAGDAPDGALTTLAEEVRARLGHAIGVVTTVPFSHATPAAFVAHATSRQGYHRIAAEIVGATRPEVVIGGGHPAFVAPGSGPRFEYLAEREYAALRDGAAGYRLVERAAGVDGGAALRAAAARLRPGERLFGLFGGAGGSFVPPVPSDDGSGAVRDGAVEDPSLAEAALAALEVVARDPDGFFLLLEQGDVDWSAHANDYPRLVGTVVDLDRAVRAVIDFVDRPGDAVDWSNTLLLVTADHATGHLRVNGPLARGRIPAPDASCAALPAEVPPYTACRGGGAVTWQSRGHTNELVSAYARGAAAERLFAEAPRWYPGTEILDQTALHGILRRAAGLE